MQRSQRIQAAAATLSHRLLVGMVSGLLAGAVAGFGSRVVMRISGILEGPHPRTLFTENAARLGEITFQGTLFLIMAGAALGALGGVFYQGARHWLPEKGRGLAFGRLMLAIHAAQIIAGDNRDFFLFGPMLVNVVLFALLFVLFGWLAALLARRLERSPRLRPQALGVQTIVIGLMSVGFVVVALPEVATLLGLAPNEGNAALSALRLGTLLFAAVALLLEAFNVKSGPPRIGANNQPVRIGGYVALATLAGGGLILTAQAIFDIAVAARTFPGG